MKKITLLISLFLTSFIGFAQTTYYSENFQSGGLSGWTVNDTDGDGNNWSILNASSVNALAVPGSLMSFSWTQSLGSLDPDNLVTSPAINLTSATAEPNMYLFFDHLLGDTAEPDKYSVYVTTSNDPAVINAATPVLTVTPTNTTYTNKSVNISTFIGQTVYISFRHYECPDEYFILIDNVVVRSVGNNDAQLVSAKLNRYSLQNTNNTLTFTVKNVGLNPITNLTINWNDGTDHSMTVNKNIAVGATSSTVVHPTAISYSSVVEKNLALSITAVNGNPDPVPSNNLGAAKFNTVSQASPKKVLFEEGTGTWCQYCPRGMVAMAYMQATYPTEFIGVAVHNADPMTLTAYDNGVNFSSFPGMNVDRAVKGADVSQSTMVSNLNTRKLLTTPVALDANGGVNGANITINAMATFKTTFANANYRLGVIITENNVTGTANGYRQSNAFSGGTTVMGGYELLPNPVPANQMVYDHVGRALLGGYTGQANSVPATLTDGQTATYTFNYTVPATSNVSNMHAVVVLIDQENGEIVNAKSVELATLGVSTTKLATFTIYPNPASDQINISNLEGGLYTITIYDMLGRIIQSDKKEILDNETATMSIKGISKGEYIVTIASGSSSYSKHLLVN